MILLLAAVQFAFSAAFAALSRWVEAGALAALGCFFLVAFFGVPARAGAGEKPLPEEKEPDHGTASADLAYLAKSGSYWLSSSLFYVSLFGMAWGATRYFPSLPVRTLLGGVLTAVSVALLVLYAATWKKAVPQVALVFRINALLLSGISAGTLLYASVLPSEFVPWVFWSHAGLSAAALAAVLATDRFADPRFLRFLLCWAAGFSWAACTYLVSLLWGGWEPVTLTAALFGLTCFWLPSWEKFPAAWAVTSRLVGALFTVAAHVSATVALWFLAPFPALLPLSAALMVFHGWLHREFRNWIAYAAAVASLCSGYVWAVSGLWPDGGFVILALCAAGLPALAAALAYVVRPRAADAWFLQYAAFGVMAGFAYVGWRRADYSVLEWSVLLMAASLTWYAAWAATSRKA